MRGKKALMEVLREEGVEYIFGNPGTSESPIMDELESYPEFKYVLVTQEGVAMGMADAYARATGKASFVNLHVETGLANGISLLHNANEGGTPLVLTSGNKDIREIVQGRTDLAEMVRRFTKWSVEVTHPSQVASAMHRAFNESITPPTGPTYVGFSANALDGEADLEIVSRFPKYLRVAPDKQAVESAVRILSVSENPIMLIGDRVAQSEASTEAVRVAEMLGAKVYAYPYSEMSFPMNHSQFAGFVRLGFPDTFELLSAGDVVLAIGKLSTYGHQFSDPNQLFFQSTTKMIHIDSDANELGRVQPTEVGIHADPKVALNELAIALENGLSNTYKKVAKKRSELFENEKIKTRNAWSSKLKNRWDHTPMYEDRMVAEVFKALPDDAIVAADAVSTRGTIFQQFEFHQPGSFFSARGGAIGWGIGGGMGLKLAYPKRPVVAIVGDGSAMMTIQGLWTAANDNVPVVYVICNNSSYRVLKTGMDYYKKNILRDTEISSQYLGSDFSPPLDIASMANAMGVYGCKIHRAEEIGAAIDKALASSRPSVLDIAVDGTV